MATGEGLRLIGLRYESFRTEDRCLANIDAVLHTFGPQSPYIRDLGVAVSADDCQNV